MKCPICDSFVHAVDTFDSVWCNGAYYDTVEGTCPDCGNSFRWTEVYRLERCENIKLIEKDDHL